MLEAITIGSAVAAAGIAGGYYAAYGIRSQVFGETIWRGRTDTNAIALTFDDGPGESTPAILDVLKQYQITATFFVVGSQVERYPELARRIAREGHLIGNHSFSHPIFLYRTPHKTRRELAASQEIISRVTGTTPTVARPPCGVRTPAYFSSARRLGLKTVQWTVAGFDWQNIGASDIAANVTKGLAAGSIILLHDGDDKLLNSRVETVRALPIIIEAVRSNDMQIVPLKELCGW
jgi:peptidoglycan/xylan/chitin deacetylase (PgdA/CDA1 family)